MTNILEPIWHIYEQSFPDDERRRYEQLIELFGGEQPIIIEVLTDSDSTVGFIIYWDFDRFVYIEHFAVDSIARGQGIGSRALSDFVQRANKPIILEVEHPTDAITHRRINFYRRLGFVLHDEKYIQPPYDKNKQSVPLCIMSKAFSDFSEQFIEVKKTLYNQVYGVNDIENG